MRRLESRWLLPALTMLLPLLVAAQPSLYEIEPNDTPAEATEMSGEVVVIGSLSGGDQDAYKWTVSDVDARRRWTFELQGVPGQLTIVEVIRVDYADNGVDVAGSARLFKMGTRDGSAPSIHEDMIFEPGEYILGIAGAGGGAVASDRRSTASGSMRQASRPVRPGRTPGAIDWPSGKEASSPSRTSRRNVRPERPPASCG